MSAPRRISEAELAAYLDNELTPEDRRDVEAWLAAAPEHAQRLAALQQQNAALQAWANALVPSPIPAAMTRTAQRLETRAAHPRWIPKRTAMAAGLVAAAIGVGLASHYLVLPAVRAEPAFVANALGAHAVYLPEVRHPVEVTSADEKHLVDWLTKRIGTEIKAPQLKPEGWILVGGRLLPDQGKPAAQMMYEDGRGRRVTLYMRQETDYQSSSFRYGERGTLTSVYWVDRPLAYAVTGNIARDELMPIAMKIYTLLEQPAASTAPGKEPRGSKE
jgi:anti-sigma factor RsiW